MASRTKAFIFLRGGGVGVGTAGGARRRRPAWTLRSGMMKDAAGGTGRMREVPVVVVGIGRGSRARKAEGGCTRARGRRRRRGARRRAWDATGRRVEVRDRGHRETSLGRRRRRRARRRERRGVGDAARRARNGRRPSRSSARRRGDRQEGDGKPRAHLGRDDDGNLTTDIFSTRGTDRPTRRRARPYPRTPSRVSTRRSRERCARAGDHSHARAADWPCARGRRPGYFHDALFGGC